MNSAVVRGLCVSAPGCQIWVLGQMVPWLSAFWFEPTVTKLHISGEDLHVPISNANHMMKTAFPLTNGHLSISVP